MPTIFKYILWHRFLRKAMKNVIIHRLFIKNLCMLRNTIFAQYGKRGRLCLPLTFPLCELLSLDSQDLTAVVGTASLASSVGHDGLTALGANRNAGSRQLPVGATALIAAGLGHFTLRDSHGDTSLVKLLLTA